MTKRYLPMHPLNPIKWQYVNVPWCTLLYQLAASNARLFKFSQGKLLDRLITKVLYMYYKIILLESVVNACCLNTWVGTVKFKSCSSQLFHFSSARNYIKICKWKIFLFMQVWFILVGAIRWTTWTCCTKQI